MKRLQTLVLFCVICINSYAQKKITNPPVSATSLNQQNQLNPPNPGPGRCAADMVLQQSINKYPSYQKSINQANQLLNQEVNRRIQLSVDRKNVAASSLPVTIPLVFHIVLPDPSLITDDMVQYQVDKLNSDFSGLNADSTNLRPTFPYSLRGHSNIRFVLARKDPANNVSTGIERRCSNTYFTAEESDPLKLSSEGGLDAWQSDKYLNIWVGNTALDGLLGYSTYPFSLAGYQEPPAIFHGIVINQKAFGNNTTTYAYNKGRTLVHEMGHFFGLFHIFQGGCQNEDFSAARFDGANPDDTPPQSGPTGYEFPRLTSCPSGTVGSGCAANATGRLYQNYMDYTDDPCMSMFTAKQVIRMETALDLFKSSLKTSDAGTITSKFVKDLQVLATIGPNTGNPEFFDCNSGASDLKYCSNGNSFSLSPSLKIRNLGTSAISELEVWYRIGTAPPIFNKKVQFATALEAMDITSIALNPITLTNGDHDLQIYTSKPDNVSDEHVTNDTIHLRLSIELPSQLPVAEGFETTAFPPERWKLFNGNVDAYTWQRFEGAGKTGQASVYMNFFDYDRPGTVDDLISPTIDISVADTILLDFERAYKQFDTSIKDYSDTLEVLVSENCGETTKSVWKKGGATLSTVPGETGLFSWSPAAGDWLKTSIDLRPFVSRSASSIRVIFRAKNAYGQNLFMDDISLKTIVKPIRDAGIVSVEEPLPRMCTGSFSPSLIIENLGEDTLRKLNLSYAIDGGPVATLNWTGSLRKFLVQKVSFNPISVTGKGVHEIIFFIDSPNDLQDERTENDTIKWRVMVFDAVNAPLTEGFENIVFPPDRWDISASDQPFRWQRTTDAAYELVASAWVNNRVNTVKGTKEELYSPIIKVGDRDSVFVSFDLSHVTNEYPGTGSPTDTLQVLLTTDCGKTYTSIYKKWGSNLNTLKEAYPANSTRDSIGFQPNLKSHWRRDSINITKALGVSSQFQLVFRNINNNDNNIFLDNIRVNPVILPDVLKNKGYQVMPNPTNGFFYIRHYLPPLNLQGIQVVNAAGQLILLERYRGNAPSTIPVDLGKQSPGIYTVRLMYSNKTVTEKIIRIK